MSYIKCIECGAEHNLILYDYSEWCCKQHTYSCRVCIYQIDEKCDKNYCIGCGKYIGITFNKIAFRIIFCATAARVIYIIARDWYNIEDCWEGNMPVKLIKPKTILDISSDGMWSEIAKEIKKEVVEFGYSFFRR
jgi:hypothetical protein